MFQVRRLLALPSFMNASVVAGHSGLDRSVGDISVMEVPDIENYTRPGSFLLSTLYPMFGKPESLERLIPRLDAAGLSGIGIKLNRYVSEIPSVCLEQADSLGFPLIILPADSDFSLQINEYLTVRIKQNHEELEHRNYIHEKSMEILLHGGSSRDLARVLSDILHRAVVLMGQSFELMAEYRCVSAPDFSFEALAESCRRCASSGELMETDFDGVHALVYVVRHGAKCVGYMAVCDRGPFELNRIEIISLQQFAMVFQVIIQNKIMMESQEYRNRELFFCDLIYNSISENEIALARAQTFNWQLSFPAAILILQISNMSPALPERQKLLRLLQQKIEWEFSPNCSHANTFWAENRSSVAVILNRDALPLCDRIASRVADILRTLKAGEVYMGLSREVSGLSGIPQAHQEAQYTLKLARQMKCHELMKFRDLGVYRIISSAQNQQDLRDFCADTIGPLVDYDSQHNSDLIRTLETVIEHGGQLNAAAKALFVHYNTIRYRCRLIEKIIKKDLSDPTAYQDISLALKIHRVLSAD